MIVSLVAGLLVLAQNAASQGGPSQGGPLVRVPSLAPAPKGDAVLAKVGSVAIRADDVAALLWESRGDEVLNDLVAYQLLKAQAEKAGVVVTDADVTKRVGETLKEYGANLPAGEDAETTLAAQGLTPGRLFLNVKSDLLLTGLANLGFRPEGYVKVSTILVVPKKGADGQAADPVSADAARAKVERAAARLRAGETWDAVAGDTIEDETGKKTGGYLGWRPLDVFPAAVREEIAKLAPGAVTAPAQTNFGTQIFRLDATGRGLKGKELEELKAAVLPDVRARILREIRTGAKVERFPLLRPKDGAKPKG